ncbi:GNAT family N-acetyltransferase [Streptomyces sp. NPDC004044]
MASPSAALGHLALCDSRPFRAFGIRAGAGEALAGTIGLRFAGEGLAPGQVNVAHGLYPSWRGRGLATRAVLLVSQDAASEGGEEAVIQVEPENPGSAAVARREVPNRAELPHISGCARCR